MNEYLEFAKRIAYHAGDVMKEYFYKDQGVEYKEDRTPVTVADKMINEYLIEEVKKTYPTHKVIGEELSYSNDSEYAWVCDPIDGTSMFTRHVPVSVFSLALVIDGEPTIGVVYDPYLDEMYTAIKGEGAYCNGKKISVNNKHMGELGCSIDYCMWNKAKYDTLDIVKEIRSSVKTCSSGSVAHGCMMLASGRVSGQIFPGTSHGNCDVAASKIIIEEAGGITSNFHGEKQRYDEDIDGFVAANKEVYDELILKLKRIYK
jgi:fructose-1,6-bisphosphatase/inositol monophosphatase family enzyme